MRSNTRFLWEVGLATNLRLLVVVVASIELQIASHHLERLGSLLHTSGIPLADCLALLAIGTIPLGNFGG